MNREEILNMPAGREMDALVAEKVMGFIKLQFPGLPKYQKPTKDGVVPLYYVPNFSTDISAAWEVVEQVTKKSKFTVIEIRGGNELYQVAFWYPLKDSWHAEGLLPLAICRAALLTVCE